MPADTNLDEAVVAGRGHPLAVRTEAQAVHRRTVALVREDAALSANVPQLQTHKKEKKNSKMLTNWYANNI